MTTNKKSSQTGIPFEKQIISSSVTVDTTIKLLSDALKSLNFPLNYLGVLIDYLKLHAFDLDAFLDSKTHSELCRVLALINQDCPIEYITGSADFFGLKFKVTRDTLIPRPLTEELVEKVLQIRQNLEGQTAIFDFGTGSGAIIISVANELRKDPKLYENTTFVATDISPEALVIAQSNAQTHTLEGTVAFLNENVMSLQNLSKFVNDATKNVIIATNPPYILESDYNNLQKSVKAYEPRLALVHENEFFDQLAAIQSSLKSLGKKVITVIEHMKDGKATVETIE